jgi:hypothetical protein
MAMTLHYRGSLVLLLVLELVLGLLVTLAAADESQSAATTGSLRVVTRR